MSCRGNVDLARRDDLPARSSPRSRRGAGPNPFFPVVRFKGIIMLHRSSPRLIVRDAGRSETIATGQIVKGVKPADLPVVQSTKFEFVINTRHDF
jgi:hypothetical protein